MALALDGADRDEVMAQLIELLAARERNHGPRAVVANA
jgi:hypothetical protein